MAHVGLALMPETSFLEASLPLFEAGEVEALEWSFDTGWQNGVSDWLLTLIENYSNAGRLTGHGVHFSLLSAEWTERQEGWLNRFSQEVQARRYLHHTEHFGFMTAGDFHRSSPLPVPLTDHTLQLGQKRFAQLASISPCPVGLENLALALHADDVLEQHEFLRRIVEPSDGFLLLDLHNIYCQLCNFDLKPSELLDNYPFHLVREIHISGGSWEGVPSSENLVRRDTHDDSVPKEVFSLLERVLPHCCNLKVVFLERLGNTLRTEDFSGFQQDYRTLKMIVADG